VGVLRRRWLLTLAVIIVCPLAAYVLSAHATKKYSASATLLFQQSTVDTGLSAASSQDQDQQRSAATNAGLASLSVVRDLTKQALRSQLPDPQVDVTVTQSRTNDLATITATAEHPSEAALVATTFANQFIVFRRRAERVGIDRAVALLSKRIRALADASSTSQVRDLQARRRDLENLAALQTGDVQLVQAAKIPTSASSPKTVLNVLLGFFCGGILGFGLAFLRDRLDQRIRSRAEIEATAGVPSLGHIPDSKQIAQQTGSLTDLHPRDAEAFRLLRAELRYFQGQKDNTQLLVTSSMPGEGKSTVAWNVALCAAEPPSRVLLIEADLRRPVLGERVGAEDRPSAAVIGLSSVLSGQSTFDEAVRPHAHAGVGELDVLYAGPKPPNPADLLQSATMFDLLDEVRGRYQLVIIDTPPFTVVSDCIPLFKLVDSVLMVTRLGYTQRDAFNEARRKLARFDAPLVGIVVNTDKASPRYAGYDAYRLPASAAIDES
jgi:capsular exopolysaccharide synthesis family protein